LSKDDDKNRKAILERRARFMAAALTATTGCDLFKPEPCLSVVRVRPDDGGDADEWADQRPKPPERPTEVAPRPCLEPPSVLPTSAPPQPCLSQRPTIPPEPGEPQIAPRPCLDIQPTPAPPPPAEPPDAGPARVRKKVRAEPCLSVSPLEPRSLPDSMRKKPAAVPSGVRKKK
jgi:hypothetical protein